MKIIFVGIHNKPGMKPLDSKTLTGKAVDAIIHKFPNMRFQKTNLCDTDFFPSQNELTELLREYRERVDYKTGDVFVLLGAWVHKNFPTMVGADVVKLPHPASYMGRQNQKKYIENAVNSISRTLAQKVL